MFGTDSATMGLMGEVWHRRYLWLWSRTIWLGALLLVISWLVVQAVPRRDESALLIVSGFGLGAQLILRRGLSRGTRRGKVGVGVGSDTPAHNTREEPAMAKVATGNMSRTDAEQARGAAQEAYDQAMQAAEKARVDLEIAVQDLAAIGEAGAVSPTEAQASFGYRLLQWMNQQPDVADATDVGLGFVGFRLAGAGDMSLSYNRTGYSPGE